MKLPKIEGLQGLKGIQIFRGEGGRWIADVEFDNSDRLFPAEWQVIPEQRWWQFASPNTVVHLDDNEEHHDVCAQVARFLLECWALDLQETVVDQLMTKKARKEKHRGEKSPKAV